MSIQNPKWEMIPKIYAADLPTEVEDWCVAQEISTHYQNDVVIVDDDGNPLAEWIKSIGIQLDKDYNYIAIIAT